jgi:hypothetical protein
MTLRARVTEQICAAVAFMEAAEFLRARPDLADRIDKAEMTFPVGPGSVGERIAEADKIAAGLGATAKWENGYYMAEFRGQALFEIHFAPLITEADALGGAA